MKKLLLDSLAHQGACCAGVVRARVFSELREILQQRGSVSLCEPDIEKRINPFLLMPEVRSIIVCLFSYCNGKRTKISEYAMGIDYHNVLKKRMSQSCKVLTDNGYRAEVYTDNSPLVERHLAYLAGLGFFGRNGMLINGQYGSKVFIGYILTDCIIEEDKPLENKICTECGKCINACPGGAISDKFGFNENLCISYLTQKKGELSKDEENLIKKGGYIWGCDICQNVCPYNYTAPGTRLEEFEKNLVDDVKIDENMTNKEFRERYSERAFSWRGKAVIKRNTKLFR